VVSLAVAAAVLGLVVAPVAAGVVAVAAVGVAALVTHPDVPQFCCHHAGAFVVPELAAMEQLGVGWPSEAFELSEMDSGWLPATQRMYP